MRGRPDIIKTCAKCGQQFKPTSATQKCCNKEIFVPCVICGAPVKNICAMYKQKVTCSTECNAKLIVQRRAEKASKTVKKCEWCGKEFTPKDVHERYCQGPHYQTCVICGKQFELDIRYYADAKTCSKECMSKLVHQNTDYEVAKAHLKETLQKKYGVDNPMQIPESADKIRQTNLEKYGAEWYTQTEEYREKSKATCLERYGVEHHLMSDEVKTKRLNTVQAKYGVTNVFQADEIKEKSKQSNQAKRSVPYVSQDPDIKDQVLLTNMSKYGVSHAMKLPEYQQKASNTNLIRYGYPAYTQSHINHIEDWYDFISDPEAYINRRYGNELPRSLELAEYFGVDLGTVDKHLNRHNALHCVRRAKSLMEEAIRNFILSICPGCQVIVNAKRIIDGFELDLYMPEYHFAIECNPTATHNSSFSDPWGGPPKPENYHKIKSDMCESKGIFLLHVFGCDWIYHSDVIKHMIAENINIYTSVIDAETCNISSIASFCGESFISSNCLDISAADNESHNVYFGLYYNLELISVLKLTKLSDCWELVRFCNKLNTSVVGGASKLFKYFVDTYNPQRIRSFSDRAHTRGRLYQTLGFKEVNCSDANYVWVDIETDKAYHRVNAQKRNLKKFLHDDTIDLTQTEKQIMESHGFAQVFDSGTITWEWNSSNL